MDTDVEIGRATVSDWSVTVLRICLAGIFIVSGLMHMLATDQVVARLASARFGDLAAGLGNPSRIVLLSGAALVIGGISLALGVLTRWAATGLTAALIPITITTQLGEGLLSGPLWKNVALFGGLIFFAANDVRGHSLYPDPPHRKRVR